MYTLARTLSLPWRDLSKHSLHEKIAEVFVAIPGYYVYMCIDANVAAAAAYGRGLKMCSKGVVPKRIAK